MVFKFKITIEGLSKPPVWRRVEVPATFTFLQFHDVIQIVFGWANAHLWNFEPRTTRSNRFVSFRIEDPDDDMDRWDDAESLPASATKLNKIFPTIKELVYVYDYGDDWRHSIVLEDVIDEERECAVCVVGKGATPPEDCGGLPGYERMKNVFAGRDKKEMKSYRKWLGLGDGDVWLPDFFCAEELETINLELRNITVSIGRSRQSEAKRPFVSKYTKELGYYSIQGLLKSMVVPQLRELSLALGFRVKSGVKKALLLDVIAERMINEPETLIKAAFYYELKAFLDIINGNMSLEYAEKSGLLFELNRLGLIYAVDYRKGKASTLHVQMDIADILAPLIPAELERRERNGALLFEKLAFGCANIYGYTDMYYLQDYYGVVEERIGRKYDDESLTDALYPILGVLAGGKKDEKGIFISPFSRFSDFIPDEEHIRFEIDPKKFDFDTILKYGEMPYPQFPGKEADAMRKVIRKYGKSECEPDEALRKMWLNHQEPEMTNPLLNIDFLNVPITSAPQCCLDAILNFHNSVPCWKLRGNSSYEIFMKEKADMKRKVPNIALEPNIQAMSIKVGRNDPCPCGSGKKYKHCCGRNQ